MKSLGFFLWICLLVLTTSGCAVALLGVGGATGYAISRDEIEGILDQDYDMVWKASTEVLARRGRITSQDARKGKIDAEVDKSIVNFSLDKPTPKTSRLRVKARRGLRLFPNIKLAQSLYDEILKSLK